MPQRTDKEKLNEGTAIMYSLPKEETVPSRDRTHMGNRTGGHAASSHRLVLRRRPAGVAASEPGGKKQSKTVFPKKTVYLLSFLTVIAAVIITAVIFRRISDSDDYSRYLDSARASIESGNTGNALTCLRKADAIRHTDEVHLLMADCYVADGNYEVALDTLREANTSSREIIEKIEEIEAKLSVSSDKASVTIAGKVYSTSVTSLSLADAELTDRDIPEIAKLYSLTSLSIAGNHITDVSPLASLGGLESLDISRNDITDLSPLSALSELRSLTADGNPISDFSPLSSLPQLISLSISDTGINAEQSAALSQSLPGCAIRLDENSNKVASVISIGGVTFDIHTTKIILTDSGISDISALSACVDLKYLDLSGNSISDITPLMSLPKLQTLVLSDNMVSNLYPLMGMTSLRCLHLEYNPISDITALTALENLNELYLTGNSIRSYAGLEKLNYLSTLDLTDTGLTDELLASLSSCFSLKLLIIENNPLLTGNAADALSNTLKNCHVSRSPLPYYITVGGTDYLDNADQLELSDTGVSDLRVLSGFKCLKHLELRNNGISNIYALEYLPSPSDLSYLDLSGNLISDINPLANLKGLETLDLSGNPLANINPLLNLRSLKQLYLYNCGLSEEALLRICNSLPNCQVRYMDENG